MKKTLWIILALVLVVALGAVFVSAEETLPETCPHCNQAVTWSALTEDNAADTAIPAGHYYLAFEADSADWVAKSVPGKVCLYMNGKTVTATSSRIFNVSGELSLIGDGSAVGRGFTDTSSFGGAVNITGKVNIYGATVTTTGEEGRTAGRGGVVYVNDGSLNVYSGSVIGGTSLNGGTVGIDDAVVNIYGGTVGGGTAVGNTSSAGGAVYVRSGGTLNIEGGTLQGGTATKTGGAIHAHTGSTLTISGGTVTGGTVTNGNGGCIYFRGTTFQMSGGVIEKGSASVSGGNIYVKDGSTFQMSGGSIKGGTEAGCGKCVYIPEGAFIELSGSASIAELRFASYLNKSLTVKGECTGSVVVRGTSGEVDDGLVIGVGENADLTKASYTVYNTDYYVIHKDSDIIVSTVGYVVPMNTEEGYCPVCQCDVVWVGLSAHDFAYDTYLRTGHYYPDVESDSIDMKTKFVVGLDRVCLDLRGKSLVSSGRAFDVTEGILNIIDTVGGGEVSGQGPSNVATVYGGTLFIREPSTVNIYGGKVTYRLPTDGRSYVTRGGVAYVRGALNIYGGEISGGAASAGANIYADADASYVGHVGLYGGTVGSNVAVPGKSTSGECIVTRGTVALGGNAQITNLLMTSNSYTPAIQNRVTIADDFTGNVYWRFSDYTNGASIGTAENFLPANATLTFATDSKAVLNVINGKLIYIQSGMAALVCGTDGATRAYATVAEAITAAGDTDYVLLLADVSDLEVSKLVHVDLNGFDITGAAGTGTLVCMDSKTDDYTVADGDYGRITGTVTCQLAGMTAAAPCSADNYLMVKEGSGISFHRVCLEITSAALRPSVAGIYYCSSFAGDELVTKLVESFGIALNVSEIPTVENMENTSLYTVLDKALFNSDSTSCLLSGVMKTDNSDDVNLSRAAMPVYAGAYVRLTDGTVLFGGTVSTNLQEQAASINTEWTDLRLVQKRAFLNMFESFEAVMRDESWSVSKAVSVADSLDVFRTTDYTPYLCPWELDAPALAQQDGKIHYYFMAGEGLHISDTQTYTDKWGDACLIVFPDGQTVLIDAGPRAYAPVITENLKRLGVTRLDYVLITHPHSDHQYGMFHDAALLGTDFMESFEIGQVYYRGGYDPETVTDTMVPRVCNDLGIAVDSIATGDKVQIGDVLMTCLWPQPGEGEGQISGGTEINSTSVTVRFDYGEHSSVFAADLYLDGEKNILERTDVSLLDADFLKIPHHGYSTSSSIEFIEAISPEVAMATGRLPVPAKIRARYENLGVTFLDDRTNGYVEVVGSADGTLEYVVSRTSATEEVPEAGDDATPDDSED